METIAFLKHRRFDPELIDSMSTAYASVCQALGLGTKSDQATETIAPKIIEIATRGRTQPGRNPSANDGDIERDQIGRRKQCLVSVSSSVRDEN